MPALPLIHLVLGNAPEAGTTNCAALLADYFRYQGRDVLAFEVSSQGVGLSAYSALQAKRIYAPRNLMTGDTKELGKVFGFSEGVRVVDCNSRDFDTVVSFLRDHHMEEHPGWMVHYVVTPGSLKEAPAGLLKLAPLMPFPLVLWNTGFRRPDGGVEQILQALTLVETDLAGQIAIPRNAQEVLALCEQHHALLYEVQRGRFGITKVAAAKDLRTELVPQLDNLLGLNTKASEWVYEYS